MIKVNLYGRRSSTSSSTKSSAGVSAGSSGSDGFVFEETTGKKDALVNLVILLFPALALFLYQQQRIPDLMAKKNAQMMELNQLQTENTKNQSITEESLRFNEEKTRLERQIKAIQKLSDGRMAGVKGLEAIQDSLPKKVWVNSLSLANQRLLIQGTALTDLDISNFMENVGGSSFLSDVDLLEAEQRDSQTIGPVKDFSVNAQLEGGT